MKKILLSFLFVFSLLFCSSAVAQNQDEVKLITANVWVKKYKALKQDIENKAVRVKDMEGLTESERIEMERSYLITTRMLEQWLDDLIEEVGENNAEVISHLANGSMEPGLKQELLDIFSYYANNFTDHYEQITGENVHAIMSNSRLMADGELNPHIRIPSGKVQKNVLIAHVKKPLSPTAWNALY